MTYHIIEQTEKYGANEIESYKTLQEAQDMLDQIINSKYDPYYEDLTADGGYLRIEDDNGSGY